ncbi:hypothetical protein C8J55DRAFT_433844, partial [Lentinula edodes]
MSKKTVVATDANGRTSSRVPTDTHLTRISQDKETNARGLRILQLCDEMNLAIVNGTELESPHRGSYTSHQHNGKAVVDYILVSQALCMLIKNLSIEVRPVSKKDQWSDHSKLSLVIS